MSQSSQRATEALENGSLPNALAILHDGAEASDADSLYLLAQWHMIGRHVPRNLHKTRNFLNKATQVGHHDAALLEISLTANGSGAPESWPAAMALLRQTADRFGGPAKDDLALIEQMDLNADGFPANLPTPQTLGTGYCVRRWEKFITPQEAAHIAMTVQDLLAPSTVADPRTGKLIQHPIRTSSAAVISPTRESLPIQAILRRLAHATGTHFSQGEPLTILHYGPGQQYRDHLDTLPNEQNQRIATALTYLNEGYRGGETLFPEQGLSITPRGGDMIVFENTRTDGSPDPRSRHAGSPITQGTKWAATRWIRSNPLNVWG